MLVSEGLPMRPRWLWLISLVLWRSGWCAAEPTLGDTLRALAAGGDCPAQVRLGSLDAGWSRLLVSPPSDLDVAVDLMAASRLAPGVRLTPADLPMVVYTQGQTVRLGGESFLVCYRAPVVRLAELAPAAGQVEAGAGLPELADPPPLTADTQLSRILFNVRKLVLRAEAAPFDLARALTEPDPLLQALREARRQAVKTLETQNLQRLMAALKAYVAAHQGLMPPNADDAEVAKALGPYCGGKLPTNPVTHQPYRFNHLLAGHRMDFIREPAIMVAFYESAPEPDGTRGVVFLDGHGVRLNPLDWAEAKADSGLTE
jgi:hypothetical protein